jgi:hypothetical protein
MTLYSYILEWPITVGAWSNEWTVFARPNISSNAGIVGSNPTWGMDICVLSFCICAILPCDGLITRPRSPTVCVIKSIKVKKRPGPNKGLESHWWRNEGMNEWMYEIIHGRPITGAARSKAWTVFARLNAGIVSSNPIYGMCVCVRLFCVCVVLCVGRGLETSLSLVQGVLPTF